MKLKKVILVCLAAILLLAACRPTTVIPIPTSAPIVPTTTSAPPISEPCGTFGPQIGFNIQNNHQYTRLSTSNGLLMDRIRTLHMTKDCLYLGSGDKDSANAIQGLTPTHWSLMQGTNAMAPIGFVNAIGIAPNHDIWVVTDGKGVWQWNHQEVWQWHTTETGLIDNRGYHIVFTPDGSPVIATWAGPAAYVNGQWTAAPEFMDPTQSRHLHFIYFHESGEIWTGSIDGGVSRKTESGWIHYDADTLGSEAARTIAIEPPLGHVLIGSDGGGVDLFTYLPETWISLSGIPDERIVDIELDHYGRRWVATPSGVYYQDSGEWHQWTDTPALSIAFGCDDCSWDESYVFIGTDGHGLIIDTLPVFVGFPGDNCEWWGPRWQPCPVYKALPTY